MWGLVGIFIFVLLLSFPGFYIITRKVFPRGSKRSAVWLSAAVTTILMIGLLLMMFGAIL